MYYYRDNESSAGGGLSLTGFIYDRLQVFLSPLLVFPDQLSDRRLVSNFPDTASGLSVCRPN
jgi:hypothetical protein